jgi:hypothetical protein
VRPFRWASVLAWLLLAIPAAARGQDDGLGGYAQEVVLANGRGPAAERALTSATRLRLMASVHRGPWRAELADEQFIQWRSSGAGGGFAALPGAAPMGDWLPLDATLHGGTRLSWRHRVDRLSLSWSDGSVSLTAGRQAIAWATTLFLSPADPFTPFNPADPFREWRTGVDAVRLRWDPGAFSELELVTRLADGPGGVARTVLARGRATVGGWDGSVWGGVLDDDPAAAVGLTRTAAGAAIRAEAEVRRSGGSPKLRAALGVDRRFPAFGRDLYVVLEYQHDALGARGAAQLPAVAASDPARRGELQLFGRDEGMVQVTWQAHPLVGIEWLTLWNLGDGSALLAPAVAISVSPALSARLGLYLPIGSGGTAARPGSEYGAEPPVGYGSLSLYL